MVDAHQNLNGSRDLITPLSGLFCLGLATINLSTEFEVRISAHYEDMKKDPKCGNGWFGVVKGHPRSSKLAPLDRAHVFY